MENEQLVQRDIEILQRAQSIGANLDFILVFVVAAFMAVVGAICVFCMGIWGMATFGVLAAAVALDYFTGIGDKATIITLVITSALLGIATMAVAGSVWMGAGAS
jgi:small-conductance mechanosensitive channel